MLAARGLDADAQAAVTALVSLFDPWRKEAACRGEAPREGQYADDPDHPDYERHPWFPGRGEAHATAKAVCRECPVRIECLKAALGANETDGIWGGLAPIERRRVRRLVGRGVPVAVAMLEVERRSRRGLTYRPPTEGRVAALAAMAL